MKLYIDSTDSHKLKILLDNREYLNSYDTPQEQDVLGFISHVLEENSVSFDDLTNIQVNPGPGSFTGTRVGVTIANALAFALKIKINGQTPPILPIYSSPPNIT